MKACITARITVTKLLESMRQDDTVRLARPLISQVHAMIPPEMRHHAWWIVPVPKVE